MIRHARVEFFGVRGTIPTPGRDYLSYGGETMCVTVQVSADTLVIFDAGTGLRQLGQALHQGRPPYDKIRNCHFFLSHYHLDHVLGLPYFAPLWAHDKLRLAFHDFGHCGINQQAFLTERLFHPPLFPVTLDQAKAKIDFIRHGPDQKEVDFDFGIVRTVPLNHPGGALGYRLDPVTGGALCYISDHEPQKDVDATLYPFLQDACVAILDTTFLEEDYPNFVGWGHASHAFAKKVGQNTNVNRIFLAHHAPTYDDHTLHKAEAALPGPRIRLAREGMNLAIPLARQGNEARARPTEVPENRS